MSNVCCAMSNEFVKEPIYPSEKIWPRTVWSSGQWVIWCFDNYISHRTTDIAHLTSTAATALLSSTRRTTYVSSLLHEGISLNRGSSAEWRNAHLPRGKRRR